MTADTPPPTDRDIARIRSEFPTLALDTVFLENAGGSQVPAVVADAMRDYMLSTYVQLGAGYGISQRSTAVVDEAHAFIETFMNGADTGRVILGPSCTQLITMLAGCYGHVLKEGDEIIVAQSGHEANVGPWVKLAEQRGLKLKMWPFDPETLTCPIEALEALLTDRTRLVAFVHVSNLLGEIVDVKRITEIVHAAGARVVVDGVAYAPHRAIDVAAWDVDWYVYSTYKVYGPHMAALYGRHDALAQLAGPNHFFIPDDEVPYKFELGGASHEGCAGLLALQEYLRFLAGLAGGDERAPFKRKTVVEACGVMTACELPLQKMLIDYLLGRADVRVIGPAHAEAGRVGTISFVHESKSSAEVVAACDRRSIGIRHGHMYAYRLCAALEMDPEDGVVRVSLLHYNTPGEIRRLIEALDSVQP